MSENSLVPREKKDIGPVGSKSQAPSFLQSRTDLPPGSVVKENSASIGKDDRQKFVCYMPNQLQTHHHPTLNDGKGKDKKEKRVKKIWLLIEEDYSKKINWVLSLIDHLRKDGFEMVVRIPAPQSVITSLLDDLTSFGGIGEGNATGSAEARSGDMGIYFEKLIGHCLQEKISDIHIEKRAFNSIIRVRKHGDMMIYDPNISNSNAERLSRIIYDIFGSDQDVMFRDDDFQVASIDWNVRGESVKLRYQSLPTYLGGFDVVLRVLPIGTDDEVITPLEDLGYSAQQVKSLLEISGRPHGALIIAGTTGSGKSTTLKNLLMYINRSRSYRCKIYTIEDPPEYRIPFVSQIPVNRAQAEKEGKNGFSEPMKAVMRGDPDILMLGEIRDEETGNGLQKATQSGHQVLSTTHATRALGIPPRLLDFGLDSTLLGSPDFLTGLIYQRLLPVLCPNCSLPFSDIIMSSASTQDDTDLAQRLEEVADLGMDNIRVRSPTGCSKCNNMSIVDRTVCAEIIAPDLKVLHAIENNNLKLAEHYWLETSDGDRDSLNMTGKSVLEHALYKMRQGIVSPYDVETTFGHVNSTNHRRDDLRQLMEEIAKDAKK